MVLLDAFLSKRREYVTLGKGFPGFDGNATAGTPSSWDEALFEKAPVAEPENEPSAYTGEEDFPTRGRYSGVGVIADEQLDFDPEPAARNVTGCDAKKAQDGSPSIESKLDLTTFTELYASRDGKLRFFEDRASGHLAAVDASKLA